MKVSLNELPDVPDITRSYYRAEQYTHSIDKLTDLIIKRINESGLKLPMGNELVEVRLNDDFGFEGLIDNKWHNIDVVLDHIMEKWRPPEDR